MKIEFIKNYIKMNRFFIDYCKIEYSSHTRHKLRGKDTAGNRLEFTTEEKKKIKSGFNKLSEAIKASLKD